MSTPITVTWPGSYTTDSILNAAAIAGGATATSNAISSNGQLDTECTLTVAYGTTAVGVTVAIPRDVDGTNFEAYPGDSPYSFQLPGTPSTTVRRAFLIAAEEASRFQVLVSNPAGNSSVTVTLRTKQAQGAFG